MKIKICGLTDVKEANYLNENKADFAGMVLFFEKSKRNISITQAKKIMGALDDSIKKVAVVVSPTVDQAKDISAAGFDIIQVHGNLSKEVYDAVSIDIWKAFNIKDINQYDGFKAMEKIKGFVFDSAEPGSGKPYDYNVLSQIKRCPGKMFILAGGLNASNVSDAIKRVQPDAVDVSSAVEFKDKAGKNSELIDEFVMAVRA